MCPARRAGVIFSILGDFAGKFTVRIKTMNHSDRKKARWQLARERFHLLDRAPQPPRRKERDIETILSDVLQAKPSEEPLPQVLLDRWPLIAGAQVATHTTPARLSHKVLTIYANHPGWLTEVRRLPKAHLLKKISAIPGMKEITDIRFQLDPDLRSGTFRK